MREYLSLTYHPLEYLGLLAVQHLSMVDYVYFTWFVCLLLLIPVLRTKTFFDGPLIYFWFYCIFSAFLPIHVWNRSVPMQSMIEKEQTAIMAFIAILLLLLRTPIKEKTLLTILRRTFYTAFIASIVTLPFGRAFISGLVPNKALNAILLAGLIPYADDPIWMILAGLFIIFFSHSSCALLALLFLLVPVLLKDKHKKEILLAILIVTIMGLIFVPDLFESGGRFEAYRIFFHKPVFTKNGSVFEELSFWDFLLGRGPGSFIHESVKIQQMLGYRLNTGYFMWLHSDPLQLLYEYGSVGVGIVGAWIYLIFKRAKIKQILSLSALVGGSIFYYPFHQPLHLALVFLNLKLIYDSLHGDDTHTQPHLRSM